MGRIAKIPTSNDIYAKVLSSKDAKAIAISGNWFEFLTTYSSILPEHQITKAYHALRLPDTAKSKPILHHLKSSVRKLK